MVHIYNRILLGYEKDWNNAICGNMDGLRDCHTNWSKSEKEKYHLYVELKKMIQMSLFTKQRVTELENKLRLPKERHAG